MLRAIGLLAILLALGFALLNSTRAKLAIANAPALWFSGEILRNVTFASDRDLSLDIYLPGTAEERQRPVVLFFHGGSWQWGAKEDYRFVGMRLAEAGFIAVLPDYRKYPSVRHPAFVEDAAASLAWVHKTISDHGGDPSAIFVSGHSAGAHLGALLSTDPSYLAAHNLERSAIRGFAGLAGPYHFFPESEVMKAIFGPEDQYPSMQAGTFVDGGEPPILMLYGKNDTTVSMANIERMEAALDAAGSCHRIQLYDDLDHISILSSFSWILRGANTVPDDLYAFMHDVLAGSFCAK